MAIYHLAAQLISRSTGRSATAAAAYRAGTRITDERTGETFDYSRKRGIDYTEIMAPANAPEWALDRAKLWNAVEHAEKRKDAQLAREVEVALPIELSAEQQIELVRGYVRSQFVDAGMVADIAIHHADGENPHAHILLTMRAIGPDGFGAKNRSWNDRALLERWRKAWEVHANQALEMAGHSARIDCRTLAEQGIARIPQIHIGPKVLRMEMRGRATDIGDRALAIEAENEALQQLEVGHECNHEDPAGPESGPDSRCDRAAGPSNGGAGRESAGQHPEYGGGQLGRIAACRGAAAGFGQHREGSGGSPAGTERPALGAGVRRRHGSYPRSSAIDRILALAGTVATGEDLNGCAGGGGGIEASDGGGIEAQQIALVEEAAADSTYVDAVAEASAWLASQPADEEPGQDPEEDAGPSL